MPRMKKRLTARQELERLVNRHSSKIEDAMVAHALQFMLPTIDDMLKSLKPQHQQQAEAVADEIKDFNRVVRTMPFEQQPSRLYRPGPSTSPEFLGALQRNPTVLGTITGRARDAADFARQQRGHRETIVRHPKWGDKPLPMVVLKIAQRHGHGIYDGHVVNMSDAAAKRLRAPKRR